LCTHSTDWSLDNRNIMHESRGYILLIAFMPVHCNFCQNQLKKLQVTTQIFREIRVVIIVAMDENPRTINYYQQEFPELTIIKDSTADRVWEKHGATPHDHFIYDRCGRLSIIIRHPRSDMSNYEDTIKSLKSALNYARCGWCQYDPQPSFRSLPVNYFLSNSILELENSR
uniref:SelP_N domain-containing protein n=1 Tax=Dracunculus medinensis TaxID=318479 RepID=A0A0N4U327_DRAME